MFHSFPSMLDLIDAGNSIPGWQSFKTGCPYRHGRENPTLPGREKNIAVFSKYWSFAFFSFEETI